jgi:hypothetical protein
MEGPRISEEILKYHPKKQDDPDALRWDENEFQAAPVRDQEPG